MRPPTANTAPNSRGLLSPFTKLLKQLGYLRLPGRGSRQIEEDGRVLHLFRNRAELKKQYGEVQEEIHRLKDRVKQQEGATARVQEALDELRMRLASSATGYQTLVHYQLRDLWTTGHDLLRSLVAELGQQLEDRERRQFLADFNRKLFSRREAVSRQLRAAETLALEERERLQSLQKSRAAANRWWQYFRRRELDIRIQQVSGVHAGAAAELDRARAEFAAVEAESAGEFPGLSLEARRAINLAAIACADALCKRLEGTQLAALAREASARREAGDDYGDVAACTGLMAQIARGKLTLQDRTTLPDEVRTRVDRLKPSAVYRSPNDVVPVEESMRQGALSAVVGGAVAPQSIDVLGEDYWDIYRALLR